jgi:hypothetical protein
MSPEIDWQVQDDRGQEEIVHTLRPKTPRWRPIAIGVVILIGVVLGVVYRSIPEPLPPPAPTPILTPTPAPPPKIEETIDREAWAIAQGYMQEFMNLQDPTDETWQQKQAMAFRAWGRPTSGGLYTIVESGTLSSERFWADVIQFQDDLYFRQTRFYQLRNNRWSRIAPPLDASFWGAEQTAQTLHFNLVYRAKDAAGAHLLADRFETFYQRVCQDVECNAVTPSTNLSLTLKFLPDMTTADSLGGTSSSVPTTYAFPSARLTGLYYQDPNALTPIENQISNVNTYGHIETTLLASIVFLAAGNAGNPVRWQTAQNGTALVGLIANWEQARIEPNQLGYDDTYWHGVLAANPTRLPLEALWTSWPLTSTQSSDIDLYWAEATALIKFMDEQYKAEMVVQFLHAIAPATSLQNAIESIGLDYRDFVQKWQAWLNKNFPK